MTPVVMADDGGGFVVLFLVWIALAGLSGRIWQDKGGSFWAVVGLSLLLSPLVGLIFAFAATPRSAVQSIAVVKVFDKSGRYIGSGDHIGYSDSGEAIIVIPSNIYGGAAHVEDLHGPIQNTVFERGR